MNPRKLKRVVIKEELVALTGHYITALILNQMIFWSERVSDFDLFLAETKRREENVEIEIQHGWIYKNANELAEELMLDASHQTVRRYMQSLVEAGYINERRNPKQAWDRTTQYRVDLVAISLALNSLGYSLEGYSMLDGCIVQNGQCNVQNGQSKVQNGQTIPKTTTKITTEDINTDQSKTISMAEPEVAAPANYTNPPTANFSTDRNSQRNGLAELMKFASDRGIDKRTYTAMTNAVLVATGTAAIVGTTSTHGEKSHREAQQTVKTLIELGLADAEKVAALEGVYAFRHWAGKKAVDEGQKAVPSHKHLIEVANSISSGNYGWETSKPFTPVRFLYMGHRMAETMNEKGEFRDPDIPWNIMDSKWQYVRTDYEEHARLNPGKG